MNDLLRPKPDGNPGQTLPSGISALPEVLTADFENQWSALIAAAATHRVRLPDTLVFRDECRRVFALSDFVAKGCVREPALLADLLARGDIERPCAADEYLPTLRAQLGPIDDEPTLGAALRRIRQREMTRIAWRDLTGRADLRETMTALSAFADACIEGALEFLYPRLCAAYGTPTGLRGRPQHLVVVGMGKLGGNELNFSSDIDLIFAFPEAGDIRNGPRTITNEAFFTRLGRRLLSLLGEVTSEGSVFRVDMRLRPYGESGPLVMSFDAMVAYYQREGREWERYAWIKARVVAGDRKAGCALLEKLKPFIYRRYLDYGVFDALREMKVKIAQEARRRGLRDNIKTGPGGIREIEFFGQIFQLLRGGVTPALQEPRIQTVLRLLARQQLISDASRQALIEAYVFLRNTEHRLQEFGDQQTHDLPQDPLGRLRVALGMGFGDWESFAACLQKHRAGVHGHFYGLLGTREDENIAQQTDGDLAGVWQQSFEAAHSRRVLGRIGFEAPDEALRLLEVLRGDVATRSLSAQGRRRLDRLIPKILEASGRSQNPLTALGRTLDLLKTIQQRTCYIALLLENPTALAHLVRLTHTSPWVVSYLAQHPVLLDELLDPRSLYDPMQRELLQQELAQQLASIDPADLEYLIEQLCVFKQVNTLRIASIDVSGTLPLMRVSDHLSDIAEIILEAVQEASWGHLTAKHGTPRCLLGGDRFPKGFAVVAYGKLGGIELGYDSDLDLVFLHAAAPGQTTGGRLPIDNPQFFARLGQRVIHLLTAHTGAGVLYEIDMRLRPSGSAGTIVSHIEAFGDYQREHAWTWEHQALIRARIVCGHSGLAERFEQLRREVLCLPREPERLRREVVDMRQRMRKERPHSAADLFDLKQGRGGIIDIEFLIQYLVLAHAHEHPAITRWTDNVRLLQSLAGAGIIDEQTAYWLRRAYLIYRSTAHRLSLQEKPARVAADKFRDLRAWVGRTWSDHLGRTA